MSIVAIGETNLAKGAALFLFKIRHYTISLVLVLDGFVWFSLQTAII
jgi:hypothetical protein